MAEKEQATSMPIALAVCIELLMLVACEIIHLCLSMQ
jgi:hypothetical protein